LTRAQGAVDQAESTANTGSRLESIDMLKGCGHRTLNAPIK
jgi:hypothetical protein